MTTPGRTDAPWRGVALVLIGSAVLVASDILVKYLVPWYPPLMMYWVRLAVGSSILIGALVGTGRGRLLGTSRPGIHLLRGLALAIGPLLFYLSFRVLSIPDAYALINAVPMFVALLAVPMLGERLGTGRALAVLAGFIGVLVIIRPGTETFTPYALLPLACAFVGALFQILTRKAAGPEPAVTSLFYAIVVGAVLYAPAMPFVWVTPASALHWALLLLMGVLGFLASFALVASYQLAPSSFIAPFLYSQLVWAVLFAWWVFGEAPDRWTVLGMAIIAAAGLYVARSRGGAAGARGATAGRV